LYFLGYQKSWQTDLYPRSAELALASVVDFVALGAWMVWFDPVEGELPASAFTATSGPSFAYQNVGVFPMHSIACFLGLVFLVIFALIAIPIIILMAKLVGFAIIGGVIALIALGIWKLFDLAELRYWPY
jgi:hypothetical protein